MIGIVLIFVKNQSVRLGVMRKLHPNEGDESARVALFLGVPIQDVRVVPMLTLDENSANWMGAPSFAGHEELDFAINKMFSQDLMSKVSVGDSFNQLYAENPFLKENLQLREAAKSMASTLELCIGKLQRLEEAK